MSNSKTKSSKSQTQRVNSTQSDNVGVSSPVESSRKYTDRPPNNNRTTLVLGIAIALLLALVMYLLKDSFGDSTTNGKRVGTNLSSQAGERDGTDPPIPQSGNEIPETQGRSRTSDVPATGALPNGGKSKLFQAIKFDKGYIQPGTESTGTIVLRSNVADRLKVKLSCGETTYTDVTILAGSNTGRFKLTLPEDYVGSEVLCSATSGAEVFNSEPLKVLESSESSTDWTVALAIVALLLAVGSMVYSFVSSRKRSEIPMDEIQQYVTELIEKRLSMHKLESPNRVPNGKVTLFDEPKREVDDGVAVKALGEKLLALKTYIDDLDRTNRLKLESQIEELNRKVANIRETLRNQPSPSAQEQNSFPNPGSQSAPSTTSLLSIDDRQKLLHIQELLSQQVVSYGRVTVATKHWGTFGTELKNQIRAMILTSNINVAIIEPEPGDPVDEGIMEIGLVPANYQMRVKEVVSLGINSPDTGDFFKAKVIVE